MNNTQYFHITCKDNKHELIIQINPLNTEEKVRVVGYYDARKRESTHEFEKYREEGYKKGFLKHSELETSDFSIKELIRLGKDSYNLDIHDVFQVVEQKVENNTLIEKEKPKQIELDDIQYWEGNLINSLKENEIFVYGANPEFRNGAGGAKAARNFGAIPYGGGRGIVGQTFGLITKNLKAGYYEEATGITYEKEGFRSVSPEMISDNIEELYAYAEDFPDKNFIITYKVEKFANGGLKRSLNGYDAKEMVDMFFDNKIVPKNIVFHDSYKPIIEEKLNSSLKLEEKEEEKYTFFFHSTSTFSQWHPAKFEYRDRVFTSAEQFMMYCKAHLFNDTTVAQEILDFNQAEIITRDENGNVISRRDSAVKQFFEGKITRQDILKNKDLLNEWNYQQKQIKALGRKVSGYIEKVWCEKREAMVTVGSREKYNQNPDMKAELLDTKDTILVEASPWDKIWGIGLKSTDPRAKDPAQWKGLNLLGKIHTNLKISYQNELKNNNANKKRMKP